MIDYQDSTTINGFNFMKKVVSWDKVIIDNKREYYEAMVHPALLLHGNPCRIVVMNDISGGVLHEVLKHSMVREVIFQIPNAEMVSLAREYLSEWNDCSSFLENATSCYDDPRVRIQYLDSPMNWFHNSVDAGVDVLFADTTMYISNG
jgi:spermidine synthase